VSIGRSSACDVTVDDERVSRRHLELRLSDEGWHVVDLSSANGTYHQGTVVTRLRLLAATELMLADPENGVLLRVVPNLAADTVRVPRSIQEPRRLRIGRASDNDLVLEDRLASRYHAELVWTHPEHGELLDTGSANGSSVNGVRVEHATTVHPGDSIEIGDTTLTVTVADQGLDLVVVARSSTERVPTKAPHRTESTEIVDAEAPRLTKREGDVLALLAGGASDRVIAETLFISLATVRSHLDRIQSKTGLRRRADLTRLALQIGIEPATVDRS
jgi:pSer/pThr/pTyr-binding forkhead associated (FHA) protein